MAQAPKMAKVTTDSASDGKAGEWSVVDTNATRGPRTHTTRGEKVTLYADKRTFMSMPKALTFLRDPAFQVWNEHGQRVQNMPDQSRGIGKMPELQPGETIAHVEELTTEALRARAAQRVGGERFTGKTTRKELIEFLCHDGLTAVQRTAVAANQAAGADSDLIADEDDDDFAAEALSGQMEEVKRAAR